MSDLISRSELLKSFEKSYCGHLGMENSDGMMTFRSIFRIIKEQPTAYDIDNVVEELKTDSSVKLYGSGNSDNYLIPVKKAIEIVKQVGVSDNVCEWKYKNPFGDFPSCRNVNSISRDRNWEFCPYCGKKIKVME